MLTGILNKQDLMFYGGYVLFLIDIGGCMGKGNIDLIILMVGLAIFLTKKTLISSVPNSIKNNDRFLKYTFLRKITHPYFL